MKRRAILIVEDEYFIADDCAQIVRAAGCDVVGPFRRVDEALLALPKKIDGALLDINLEGERAYRLLDQLLSRNVPVAIYTGYDPQSLPKKYSELPIVTKPSNCADAVQLLTQNR